MSSRHTFEPEERTARAFFLAPVEPCDEDRTLVDPVASGARYRVGDSSEHAVLTADMLEELRRRLRDAEAEEASGVRLRPTSDAGGGSDWLGEDGELEIDVDLEELEGMLSVLPELEAALAPNSESNFYAGFDDEHPDGVFLATYAHLEVGAPVYLTVLLPAGHRFRTPAIVEWVAEGPRRDDAEAQGLPRGVGLSMCGLDASAHRLIRSFVRQRKPIFYVS